MGSQAGEQCVHEMLRGSSGLTLYLFLKAPFVISGFCIGEDPAAGLNHCIPIWAAHRNHPGGKTHTKHHRLYCLQEARCFKTAVCLYFWKHRAGSEVPESRAIFWSSQAPKYLRMPQPHLLSQRQCCIS